MTEAEELVLTELMGIRSILAEITQSVVCVDQLLTSIENRIAAFERSMRLELADGE